MGSDHCPINSNEDIINLVLDHFTHLSVSCAYLHREEAFMCSLHMIFTMGLIWSLRNCMHNSMHVNIMVITNNIENMVKEYALVIVNEETKVFNRDKEPESRQTPPISIIKHSNSPLMQLSLI